MNFLQRLFKKKPSERIEKKFVERPPDWSLKISDLMEEMKAGKRKSISGQEIDWAREYERSLIPQGYRFPQKGDLYEALKDMTVDYITAWSAPYSGGGETSLMIGEQVWIDAEIKEPNPIGAYALPVKYEQMEQRIVAKEERESPKYGGFHFYLTTVELNENFKLLQTGYKKWQNVLNLTDAGRSRRIS
ncbi:MAG: hypothetical protein HQL10_05365 [Nitrospirae bacterium]|nr:hypothetical protein [Nitrospirota bacterium]